MDYLIYWLGRTRWHWHVILWARSKEILTSFFPFDLVSNQGRETWGKLYWQLSPGNNSLSLCSGQDLLEHSEWAFMFTAPPTQVHFTKKPYSTKKAFFYSLYTSGMCQKIGRPHENHDALRPFVFMIFEYKRSHSLFFFLLLLLLMDCSHSNDNTGSMSHQTISSLAWALCIFLVLASFDVDMDATLPKPNVDPTTIII